MKSMLFTSVLLAGLFFSAPMLAQQSTAGYAMMRVFDCNKSVALGTGFIAARILIVYDDGSTEDVELAPYSEKTELENLKKITEVLNRIKAKGYFLVSQSTTGDQGSLITDYTFMRQP